MKDAQSTLFQIKVFGTLAIAFSLIGVTAFFAYSGTPVMAQTGGTNASNPATAPATGPASSVSIAVDPSGNVFIADSTTHKIQKFSANKTWLTAWGTTGTGDGFFQGPMAITTDQAGNVYVLDSGQNKVQVFDTNGVLLRSWSFNPDGSAPVGGGNATAPVGGGNATAPVGGGNATAPQ